jgi:hypothetical protein
MKKVLAALALALSVPAMATGVEDVSVFVDYQNDAWSCTNSLNAGIANAYNRCVFAGGRAVQHDVRACQQGPHSWYGSSRMSCVTRRKT